MENTDALRDEPTIQEVIGAPNPAWDDTPEEPTALAYSPDPIGERVFITEAYAHDVVKLAEIVNVWMCVGHVENGEIAAPVDIFNANPVVFFSVETNINALREVVRISNDILARGEE